MQDDPNERASITIDELRRWRVSEESDTPGNIARLKYLILTEMRSGSSLICDLLQRRGAGFPIEYLNPNYFRDFQKRFGVSESTLPLDLYFARLCRIRTSASGHFGFQCVSRDLLGVGLGQPIIDFLQNFDRIILFSRKDKLAQAVSIMRAFQTGRWESWLAPLPNSREMFNAALLSRIIAKIYVRERDVADHLASVDRPVLSIEYEAIRDSLEAQWVAVQTFLGLEPVSAESLGSKLKRQADAKSDDYAQRYIDLIQGRGE